MRAFETKTEAIIKALRGRLSRARRERSKDHRVCLGRDSVGERENALAMRIAAPDLAKH